MRAIRRALPTLFLAGLVVYFAYHAMSGDQGLLAWAGYKARLAELEAEAAAAEAERLTLEARADRLRDNGLDLDLVDERARDILGFAHPDDYVITVGLDNSYVK